VLEKKRFLPTDVGRLVNGFLTSHFNHYLDYGFTANLETELDEISNGALDWISVMGEFWTTFASDLSNKESISRGIPLPAAEPRVRSWESYSRSFLDPAWQEAKQPELCPKCNSVVLLQNSSRGLFVGCSAYPDCDYTEPFGSGPVRKEPLALGMHKQARKTIYLLTGPYGPYVQIGETPEPGSKEKPKRAAWPKGVPLPGEATPEAMQIALKALSLPRQLGNHPETGKPVEVNIGRFGPYIKHDGGFKSIPKTDSVYDIKLDRAVELLAQAKTRTGGGRKLGNHPDDERAITVHSGRYGPYLKYGSVNVTIPESVDPEKITVEQAVELIAEKTGKAKKSSKGKAGARTSAKPRKSPGRGASSARATSTGRAAAAKKKPRRKSTRSGSG
jgi:DNA topoisomerase-1